MTKSLYGQAVLITGATGLIGQAIVRRLLQENSRVTALVRDRYQAEQLFGQTERLEYLVSDVTELKVEKMDVDYIIHGASNTSSRAFIQDPVGVAFTALEGTRRILELAKHNQGRLKGLVFLSSMEVYGAPATDDKIDEKQGTNLDTMTVRTVYPESKRMCENLCACYARQFGIPSKVVRLTQTFGPGVKYDDGRVFADFARCVIEGRDIILHTNGETKRCYLYTEDAVSAILTILVKGEVGEAYNAANEETYCSVFELAQMAAQCCEKGEIQIRFDSEPGLETYGYAPTLHMNLDTAKIRRLGWRPEADLRYMFEKMIEAMRCAYEQKEKSRDEEHSYF